MPTAAAAAAVADCQGPESLVGRAGSEIASVWGARERSASGRP